MDIPVGFSKKNQPNQSAPRDNMARPTSTACRRLVQPQRGVEPPDKSYGIRGLIWVFPKMVVPNNHNTIGFPTKNDQHWGVKWGYHYFWKHPYIYPPWFTIYQIGNQIPMFFFQETISYHHITIPSLKLTYCWWMNSWTSWYGSLSQYLPSLKLVGGWTNPSEKYARQIRSFPQGLGWTLKNMKPPPGNIAPENSWLEDKPFLFGARPIFRGYVSFRECTPLKTNEWQWKILNREGRCIS